MDDHVLDPFAARQLDDGAQMLHARVDATVGDEPEQMQPLGAAGGLQRLVLVEGAVLDRLVDTQQVLLHHGPRAQVQVAHLGVPHLALGQPHRGAVRHERRVRVLLPQLVEHGRVGQVDRVARPGLGEPPAVQHDEADTGKGHGTEAAISTNPFGSRLAPPTSAPSTSGWARISAALSGLTLPP